MKKILALKAIRFLIIFTVLACLIQELGSPIALGQWIPVKGGEDLVQSEFWEDVAKVNFVDGKLLIIGADKSFTTVINQSGFNLEVFGNFGVSATIASANDDFAGISLYGVLPEKEWWKGAKRLDVGIKGGQVNVNIYDGTGTKSAVSRYFKIPEFSRTVQLGMRNVDGDLLILVNDTELGRLNNIGLFDSGKVYIGACVAPKNQMTIQSMRVEAEPGNEDKVKIIGPYGVNKIEIPKDVQDKAKQLIGTWTGVIQSPSKTRTLEIQQTKKWWSADGETFAAKGLYGITGGKLEPITIEVRMVAGLPRLVFVTSAKSRIEVTWTNARRMDGTFTDAKEQQLSFRLWKSDGAPVTDPALTPLLGTWDGKWTSGLITHMRMDFIDATGASITYAWEDSPSNGKAGWGRYNAKVLEGSTIELLMGGKFTHRYSLSTFFGKYLRGDCQPCNGNNVVWSPSTTFPKIE